MTDINLKRKNFEFFLKNLKNFEFDVKQQIKDFKYFIPKYYFKNNDKNITNYYKNKFLIDKINKNNNFIQEILKFNKDELENIEINISTYVFDKKCLILNGKLGNNSSDLKKFTSNSDIYLKKNKNNNQGIKCKFYSNESTNNVYDLYKVHKSFFQNYTQPLYILLINNEYNKNSDNKKYFLKLLNSQVTLVNNLFTENILGSLSKKSIFEIIEKYSNNNINSKNNNIGNKDDKIYKIYGNNSNINTNTKEEERRKFYYDINDMNLLYQTYNINVEISNTSKTMKEHFNLFHTELKKIVSKKIKNLFDLLICSLNMEKHFINFLLYYFNNDELQKLYQLDNTIKLSIFKNIDVFKSFYNSYRSELDNNLLNKGVFDPVDFKLYFNEEINELFLS